MASPFPGMDPYLEHYWGDVHQALITYARDQLQADLPSDLRARVGERVFVESATGSERSIYPDLRVMEVRPRQGRALAVSKTAAVVAEPLRFRLSDEPVTQGYIEIIDVATQRRVVTVIEVLSLSNKVHGPGRVLFQQKQQECKDAGVNLVEIDLLRSGPWVLTIEEHRVPPSHRTAYRVSVYRAEEVPIGEFYAVPLRERLPVIKVPLRPKDDDVELDLQPLIDQCYHNGGYDEDINYQGEPDPPLDPADARWADALLRKKRRRSGPKRPGRRQRRKA